MLTIGDFARLSGLSVRMLHHYDAIGLLPPDRVDEWSGYRYYRPATLDLANRIVALRALGFSLDQTRSLLVAPPAELRQLLTERAAALRDQIAGDRHRLAEVESRLRLIEHEKLEKEDVMSHTALSTTSLPALRLAQLTASVADPAEIQQTIGPLFDRVVAAVEAAGLPLERPGVAHYTGTQDGMLIAAAEQVDADHVEGLQIVELPPVPRAVTVVHEGSLATISESWQRLVQSAADHGLSAVGTCREIYHRVDLEHDRGWRVELQQPVE